MKFKFLLFEPNNTSSKCHRYIYVTFKRDSLLGVSECVARVFPWCLGALQLSSYHFYKVIELLIRAEDGLSREIVKHLNHVSSQYYFAYASRDNYFE